MARKAMVTRTIESTKCVVLCLDTVTCEPCNKVVELPRTYKNEEALMRKVRKAIETEDLKAVKIVSAEKVEGVYGMAEADFLAHAIKLDPKTRKALEEEGAGEDEDEDEADEVDMQPADAE